jgi:hypothetical protein
MGTGIGMGMGIGVGVGVDGNYDENDVRTMRPHHTSARMLINPEVAKASEHYNTSSAPAAAGRPQTAPAPDRRMEVARLGGGWRAEGADKMAQLNFQGERRAAAAAASRDQDAPPYLIHMPTGEQTLSRSSHTHARDALGIGSSSLDTVHNMHNLSPNIHRRAAEAQHALQPRASFGTFASNTSSKSQSIHERSSWGGPALSLNSPHSISASPNNRAVPVRPHTSHLSHPSSQDMFDNMGMDAFEGKYLEHRGSHNRAHLADRTFDLKRDRTRNSNERQEQEETCGGDTKMGSTKVSKSRILALRNSGVLGAGYALPDELDMDMDKESNTYSYDAEAHGSKNRGIMRYSGNYRDGYLDDSDTRGAQVARYKGDVADGYDLLGIKDRQDFRTLNSDARARAQGNAPADLRNVEVLHDEDVDMHQDASAAQTWSKHGSGERAKSPEKRAKSPEKRTKSPEKSGEASGRKSVLTFSDLASLW